MEALRIVIPFVICLVNAQDYNINILNLLDALKNYGALMKPANMTGANQFVSVTVLAKHEIRNLLWLENGSFPESFINDGRVRVQYNRDKNKVHGEKIILEEYLYPLVEEMINDNAGKFFVLLFSWYIPCTLKKNTCAEKLVSFVNFFKVYMFVGFSNIFINYRHGGTTENVKNSFRVLDHANISVFYLVKYYNGIYVRKYRQKIYSLSRNFQSNMFDCIIQNPISFCCGSNYVKTDPGKTNLSAVDSITTFSINTMVYSCITKPQNENFTYHNCFLEWSKANIGTTYTCKKCWNDKRSYRFITESCINQTYRTSTNMHNEIPEHHTDCNKEKSKEILNPATFCTKPFETHLKSKCKVPRQRKIQKAKVQKKKSSLQIDD